LLFRFAVLLLSILEEENRPVMNVAR